MDGVSCWQQDVEQKIEASGRCDNAHVPYADPTSAILDGQAAINSW